MNNRGLLLDTHIWVWLSLRTPHLKSPTIDLIDRAQAGGVAIAAISLWETAMMADKKRIALDKDVHVWLREALQPFSLLPLSPEVAAESMAFHDGWQADPADRLIIATAKIHNLTLVTRDRKILDYAQKGHFQAIEG